MQLRDESIFECGFYTNVIVIDTRLIKAVFIVSFCYILITTSNILVFITIIIYYYHLISRI